MPKQGEMLHGAEKVGSAVLVLGKEQNHLCSASELLDSALVSLLI